MGRYPTTQGTIKINTKKLLGETTKGLTDISRYLEIQTLSIQEVMCTVKVFPFDIGSFQSTELVPSVSLFLRHNPGVD